MSDNSSLTPQEVADILKIAKTTVYELIKRGELNAYRIGRRVRVELSDVEEYKNRSKNMSNIKNKVSNTNNIAQTNIIKNITTDNSYIPNYNNIINNSYNSNENQQIKTNYTPQSSNILLIAGEDIILDTLSRYLSKHPKGSRTALSCVSSYRSLVNLYEGEAHIAACHLWDSNTDEYNVPYVEKFLPGIPALIIHLVSRIQGFYVQKGNPKNITSWEDLRRNDITFANRENGAGTRVLLDQHLKSLGISGKDIKGYSDKYLTHVAVASIVSSGKADFGLGIEKTAHQIQNIDFIPLQKERYELILKKEDLNIIPFDALIDILHSENFKMELNGIEGYDLSEIGKITEV